MCRKPFWTLLLLLLAMPLGMAAQDAVTASGTVVDATGEPLIGCTVLQKGSANGTTTDIDGNFKLQVPRSSVLVISFIGYKAQELKPAEGMKVVLKEDSQLMEEVVVVGYGTMKRSDITGSVVSVKAEGMQQTSASTMDQMLQGRAAGMQLTSNSGAAGGSSSILIRGVNSLNSSNEPVYVIDGAIVTSEAGSNVYSNPLADLNPNDVESIEILKDASATAIYGAQAANGVIIVNMKKGFEGSAPKIGFKAQVGWDMYANTPMDATAKKSLYPALREQIKGRGELESVERLLNWVQTAFVYEYDDKVWGGDRAFFPDETLYYPYCDCEDRSILFTRLVRDLLGLKCILIYYPGHLASAVCFTDRVVGDYINVNGSRYVVCDPTYIGASVGHTMPDMDNASAKVIVLP